MHQSSPGFEHLPSSFAPLRTVTFLIMQNDSCAVEEESPVSMQRQTDSRTDALLHAGWWQRGS